MKTKPQIRTAIMKEIKIRGWSRYRLAAELKKDIGQQHIYRWVRGEVEMSEHNLEIILKLLNLKVKK